MKIVIFHVFTIMCVALDLLGQHSITRLPYPLNTRDYDEICPVFDFKESLLFYTKVAHPRFNKTFIFNGEDLNEKLSGEAYEEKLAEVYSIISGSKVRDAFVSSYNQDVWVAQMDSDDFKVLHPGYPLNDALPNSICSTFGENSYVIINQFFETGGMQEGFSTITLDDHINASFPEAFVIRDFDLISSEVNLTMSHDQQVAILAFRRQDQEDKDLYVSIKINDTLYGSPTPLNINTSANETTPFISRDKTKIYFASDRSGGRGGLDLYVTERLDYTYSNWSTPTAFNRFLNTSFDESHPFVTQDGHTIYYTTNKDGSSDIYKASLVRDTIMRPITVHIKVVREGEEKAHTAQLYWRNTFDPNEEWVGFRRIRDGYHKLTINKNEPLDIKADNRNWKSQIMTIDPQELQDKGIFDYYIDLVLTEDGVIKQVAPKLEADVEPELSLNLVQGEKMVLDNIYFSRGKDEVLPESFSTLRTLARILKKNPNIIIRVEGHTDNVGDAQALLDLSIARAVAIQSFLKSDGVPDYQVDVAGYGGDAPITDNSTEVHRRKNRRVEIRVLRQ